jgi:hypothetical protein
MKWNTYSHATEPRSPPSLPPGVFLQVPPYVVWEEADGDLHWSLPAWLWGRVLRRTTSEKSALLIQTYDTRLIEQGVPPLLGCPMAGHCITSADKQHHFRTASVGF